MRNFVKKAKYILFISALVAGILVASQLQSMAYDTEDFEFKWILPPEFHSGMSFSEGRAWAQEKRDGTWTLFDIEGNVIKDGLEASIFGPYKNGLSIFADKKLKSISGLVNISGDVLLAPSLKDVTPDIGENLITEIEISEKKYGFVDFHGKWVISPKYEQADKFSEGLAPVRMNGKFGYIDKNEETAIDFSYDEATPFYNGVAIVRVGKLCGLIDKNGDYIVEPQFEIIDRFGHEEGIIGVVKENKIGFIDLRGNIIVDFKYFYDSKSRRIFSFFRDGRAIVFLDEHKTRRVVIDENGDTVFEIPEEINLFSPGRYNGNYIAGWDKDNVVIFEKNGRCFDITGEIKPFYEGLLFNIISSQDNVFIIKGQKPGKFGYFTIIPKEDN
jgi:hypothetical protein